VASTTVVTGSTTQAGNGVAVGTQTAASTATCPVGTKLLGGGATTGQGGSARIALSSSGPNSGGTGWTATGMVVVSGTGSTSVTAYAVCGS
jgi:hypothetical protein